MQNIEQEWHLHTQAMDELDKCIEEENAYLKKFFTEEDWVPSSYITEKRKKTKKMKEKV